jgi:hypothetical protein
MTISRQNTRQNTFNSIASLSIQGNSNSISKLTCADEKDWKRVVDNTVFRQYTAHDLESSYTVCDISNTRCPVTKSADSISKFRSTNEEKVLTTTRGRIGDSFEKGKSLYLRSTINSKANYKQFLSHYVLFSFSLIILTFSDFLNIYRRLD